MNRNEWNTVQVDDSQLGSFNTIKVMPLTDEFFTLNTRKKVTLTWETLPTANGYWSLDGREFKVIYKKKTIALLRTEDCGMGTYKARTFLEQGGFRIA